MHGIIDIMSRLELLKTSAERPSLSNVHPAAVASALTPVFNFSVVDGKPVYSDTVRLFEPGYDSSGDNTEDNSDTTSTDTVGDQGGTAPADSGTERFMSPRGVRLDTDDDDSYRSDLGIPASDFGGGTGGYDSAFNHLLEQFAQDEITSGELQAGLEALGDLS
jgi:hypothetical protein